MANFIENIFKNKKVNLSKLSEFGFVCYEGIYTFHKVFDTFDFEFIVYITKDGEVSTKMVDLSTNELYTLYLIESAAGNFVGQIRSQCEIILNDIANKCFEDDVFKTLQSKSIIEYVKDRYGDELEFLWEKFPDTAVWRRKDNKKWYGVLMTVSKSKLGINSKDIVEIIDLRISIDKLQSLIDNKKVFPGYHMNKKHWITIVLDDSALTEEITSLIDSSYALALK
ncbi:MAG: MmcQ/YjbR family DNA-binding protein [Erysipelotrichales bacterium]|nr:MmcQ/YjbR family DNA-binding protein [Erysipelotrichales bacterium]